MWWDKYEDKDTRVPTVLNNVHGDAHDFAHAI